MLFAGVYNETNTYDQSDGRRRLHVVPLRSRWVVGRRAVCSVARQVQYRTLCTVLVCFHREWSQTVSREQIIATPSSSHSAFIRWTLDFKYIRRNFLEEHVFQLLCFNNVAMSLLFEIESLVHIFLHSKRPSLVLCANFLQTPNRELFILFWGCQHCCESCYNYNS